MPMTLTRSATGTHTNISAGTTSTATSYCTETHQDTRRALEKTPRGDWRPPTPYWRRVYTGDNDTYRVSSFYSDWIDRYGKHRRVEFSGYLSDGGYYGNVLPPSDNESMKRYVEGECLRKLKRQHINLAQAFGERKQTARLVQGNLVKIAGAVRALKRLDGLEALKHLGLVRGQRRFRAKLRPEGISDFWLEMQYGWKPLLGDIYGAVKHHNEIEADGSRLVAFVSKKTGRKPQYIDRVITHDALSGLSGSSLRLTERIKRTEKMYARFDFVRSDPISPDVLTQLGLTNPFELAWELMPFSFVLDWSLPLGDYFHLLDAVKGWKLKGGSRSYKVVDERTPIDAHVEPPSTNTSWYRNWTHHVSVEGKGRRMYFNRVTYVDPPDVPRPEFDTGSSHLHVANGLALLASAFLAPIRYKIK